MHKLNIFQFPAAQQRTRPRQFSKVPSAPLISQGKSNMRPGKRLIKSRSLAVSGGEGRVGVGMAGGGGRCSLLPGVSVRIWLVFTLLFERFWSGLAPNAISCSIHLLTNLELQPSAVADHLSCSYLCTQPQSPPLLPTPGWQPPGLEQAEYTLVPG